MFGAFIKNNNLLSNAFNLFEMFIRRIIFLSDVGRGSISKANHRTFFFVYQFIFLYMSIFLYICPSLFISVLLYVSLPPICVPFYLSGCLNPSTFLPVSIYFYFFFLFWQMMRIKKRNFLFQKVVSDYLDDKQDMLGVIVKCKTPQHEV